MTYLKRKIDEVLRQWKSKPDRKPLIVKGPRQVGKTESVMRFAEANYQSVVYINFVEEPKYKLITGDGYKTDDVIRNISRMDPSKEFIPGETLIFFDELQEHPDIATALKFFHMDGRFDRGCAGIPDSSAEPGGLSCRPPSFAPGSSSHIPGVRTWS